MNRPKSATEFPELSMKSSGFAHREQIQFGSGATTYVATTINGRKLCQMADDRITRRNPTARTYGSFCQPRFFFHHTEVNLFECTHKRQSNNRLNTSRHCEEFPSSAAVNSPYSSVGNRQGARPFLRLGGKVEAVSPVFFQTAEILYRQRQSSRSVHTNFKQYQPRQNLVR